MEHHPSAVVTADPPVGQLYTTDEVAQLLRVSQRTVQVWIRDGMLTAVRYGRLLRIRQADLAAFGEVLPGAPPRLRRGREPQSRASWRGAGVSPSPLDTPQSLHSAPLLLMPTADMLPGPPQRQHPRQGGHSGPYQKLSWEQREGGTAPRRRRDTRVPPHTDGWTML
jgi:excisionase family DNA binding protein